MNVIDNKTTFIATDGLHQRNNSMKMELFRLQMKDVDEVKIESEYVFLNTGSPHHVTLVDDLENYDVKNNGAKITIF